MAGSVTKCSAFFLGCFKIPLGVLGKSPESPRERVAALEITPVLIRGAALKGRIKGDGAELLQAQLGFEEGGFELPEVLGLGGKIDSISRGLQRMKFRVL